MRLSNRKSLAPAFTLIEILVVIAIIGLLMGLLLAGIQRIRSKGPELATKHEIGQIGNAIESFKTTMDVKYIPSAWILAKDYNPNASLSPAQNAALADSRRYYSKIWPKASANGITNTPNAPASDTYLTLDGNQVLLFLLGGIPPQDTRFTWNFQGNRTGFLNSPTNPFNVSGGVSNRPTDGSVAKGPFFDFDPRRIDVNGHYHDPHWLPPPPTTDPTYPVEAYKNNFSVYYYFSSKEGNDYGFFGTTYMSVMNPTNDPAGFTPAGGYFYVNPFIGPDGKFINPGGYQLVSAGADQIPGPGGAYQGANSFGYVPGWQRPAPFPQPVPPVPAPAPNAPRTGGGADDQSNWSTRVLGAAD